MVFRVLAIARDVSVLLLAIEILALLSLPIFVLWYTTRALKSFIPQVAQTLQDVKAGWFRVVSRIDLILAYVRAPFLWIASRSEGLRVFLSQITSD